MNNLQWAILFLVAFTVIAMIWFARTMIPDISISPHTTYAPALTPSTQQASALSSGPKVTVIGNPKSVDTLKNKLSYVPIDRVELKTVDSYRVQNGQKILVFQDGSQRYLTPDEYRQLSAGVRLRFEYKRAQP